MLFNFNYYLIFKKTAKYYSTDLQFKNKTTSSALSVIKNNLRKVIYSKVKEAIRSCSYNKNSILVIGDQNLILLSNQIKTTQRLNFTIKHDWKPAGEWLIDSFHIKAFFDRQSNDKYFKLPDSVTANIGLVILLSTNARQCDLIADEFNKRSVPVAAVFAESGHLNTNIAFPLILNTNSINAYVLNLLGEITSTLNLTFSLVEYMKLSLEQSSQNAALAASIDVAKRKFWPKRRKIAKR